jgi:hypothetical protein
MPPESDDARVERLEHLLGQIDLADHERVEPPPHLWGRIAASLAADGDVEPGAGTVVEYWIDAEDELLVVGADWSSFARGNHAPELADTTPDRTLWSYFDGDEVRDLWRLLVARVRATGTAAQVPLRCDAPDRRRWFEMTITPVPDDVVHFRCSLVFEEARDAVELLDAQDRCDPGAAAVPVCSWCGDAHDGHRWRRIEDVVRERRLLEKELQPPIRHGVCPTCSELMSSHLLAGGGTSTR